MKKFSLLVFSLIVSLVLSSCSGGKLGTSTDPGTSTEPGITDKSSTHDAASDGASITIFMAKPEVGGQFEEMLATYSKNTGINVTMIPLPAGQDAYEKMTTLYASGNAPSILMVGQEFVEFQDKFLDLSDTGFAKKAGDGTMDFVTVDSKVYGVPTTVEAYGIIYNPKVVAEVFAADYDPTQIQTIDAFKEFMEGLKAGGVGFSYGLVVGSASFQHFIHRSKRQPCRTPQIY